ncbi:hypothetical protein [Paenibacillus sp. FSL R7-0331]|nr:hypothetical protein [Paenibacillus sp. FSL R7-0331]
MATEPAPLIIDELHDNPSNMQLVTIFDPSDVTLIIIDTPP